MNANLFVDFVGMAIAITTTSSAKLGEILTYYSDSNQPASVALVYVDERFAGATMTRENYRSTWTLVAIPLRYSALWGNIGIKERCK